MSLMTLLPVLMEKKDTIPQKIKALDADELGKEIAEMLKKIP